MLNLTTAQQRDLQMFRSLTGHLNAPHTVREWLDVQVRKTYREWQTCGRIALCAHAAALAAREAYEPSDESFLTEDERAGFEAFPSGRWMDAMRGNKSYPSHARCPFRDTFRVGAWKRGYNEALAAVHQ